MNTRQHSSRWALWAFAAALLLKSAMPWLASASAQIQGKTLVQVCTVYGVSMVAPGDDGASHAPDSTAGHGSEHCALTALVAFAADASGAALPAWQPMHGAAAAQAPPVALTPDACAAWAARLRHGPPAFA